jgi:Glycosyltransferase family 92
MDRYLSVCAIYFEEGPYLREWIEFHRLVGVEQFFLYNNESTDDHRELLAPYIAEGTVVVHDWPIRPGQIPAYEHCLETHGAESRWIAFIDLDEFVFSPTLTPVSEILRDYEEHPAVAINWAMFGTSGHRTKPPGLVLENYRLRKDYPPGTIEHVKCIVDPRRVARCIGAHSFEYTVGFASTEDHRLIDKPPWAFSPASFKRLQVNHYARRSEEEYAWKLKRGRADTGEVKNRPPETYERRNRLLNAVADDTIKAYLPRLREAMERIDARLAADVRGE